MPQGTCFCQDVQGGILISIKNHTTTRANVCANTQRLFDERAALRACLTGELGSHRNDGNVMHCSIGVHPRDELPPASIMNGPGKVGVLDHVADLKVLVCLMGKVSMCW